MAEESIKRNFSRKKLIIPIVLGLAVVFFMLYQTMQEAKFYEVSAGTGEYTWTDLNKNKLQDFTDENDFTKSPNGNYNKKDFFTAWSEINWGIELFFFLFLAIIMIAIRDLAYMWRIRVLSDHQLSWKQSFHVIMMWEFASALTPGVVGGAAVAMFILKREKINFGKATTIVMVTAVLDELFYVLVVPILILTVGIATLFPYNFSNSLFGNDFAIETLFWIAFSIIALITVLLFLAIFIIPGGFKKLLVLFSSIPGLKKFKPKLEKLGDEIIITSSELKDKNLLFWVKAFGATILSWTARFLVLNFVLMAFNPLIEHAIVFARQLSMWVILLVSPSPGGSGIAEIAFSGFLYDFIPFGLAGIIALVWRLISYYLYLIMGAVLFPVWYRKTAK